MIKIGDRVRHRINGFEGIVTGTTEYINGCRQHLITPESLDEGKVREGLWTDEQNITRLKAGVLENPFAKAKKAVAGGPEGPQRQR